MSGEYLDQDTRDLSIQFLRDGGTLAELAGRLHFGTELLGRLLQLPTRQTVATDETTCDLWRVPELESQL